MQAQDSGVRGFLETEQEDGPVGIDLSDRELATAAEGLTTSTLGAGVPDGCLERPHRRDGGGGERPPGSSMATAK